MSTSTLRAVRLRIKGRVQGVAYRHHAVQEGRTLRLSGWIRNRHDGDVEALVRGEPKDVDAFVQWCRRGPALARVDDVQVAEADTGTLDAPLGELEVGETV